MFDLDVQEGHHVEMYGVVGAGAEACIPSGLLYHFKELGLDPERAGASVREWPVYTNTRGRVNQLGKGQRRAAAFGNLCWLHVSSLKQSLKGLKVMKRPHPP